MRLIFDLDGTLTDSRDGIVRCYQHALGELGRPIPAASSLTTCVGPPLAACFKMLLETDDPGLIEQAVASYRRRFEERGMFENALYDGVAGLLEDLARNDHELYVVTAKPAVYANTILTHFGIDRLFRAVYGPELGQRFFDKGALVGTALEKSSIPPALACMIGDRSDDIAAARDNGLCAIGVTWGYGSVEELIAAGAQMLAESPQDLANRIAELSSLADPG